MALAIIKDLFTVCIYFLADVLENKLVVRYKWVLPQGYNLLEKRPCKGLRIEGSNKPSWGTLHHIAALFQYIF